MSQENVETLRTATQQAVKNPEALYAIFDPAIEWDTSAQLPDGDVCHGTDAVRRFFNRWVGAFEDYGFEFEEMVDVGNEVLAVMSSKGKGKVGGVQVEVRFAQIWTFRNGKVVRYRGFRDRAEALDAVGLSE